MRFEAGGDIIADTLIVEGNSNEMVSIRGRAVQYNKLHAQGIAKNQAFHALFSLRGMLHTQVQSSTTSLIHGIAKNQAFHALFSLRRMLHTQVQPSTSFIHRVLQRIRHFMPYFL